MNHHRLGYRQLEVLAALAQASPQTAVALAGPLQLSVVDVWYVARSLAARDLVAIDRPLRPGPGRGASFALTPAGADAVRRVRTDGLAAVCGHWGQPGVRRPG
jgi:DNA-binding MarR family transcriptional regulator